MNKEALQADGAPKAVGPYSQGIVTGDMVYLSGQIPIDPATGKLIEGTVAQQTERVISNIKVLLDAAGCTLHDVVKATVFMVDLAKFSEMNEVYARHFQSTPPARSTVQVAALPLASQVEIEVIARRP